MASPEDAYVLNVTGLRDLAPEVMDDNGLPKIKPASFYAEATAEERAWLGLRHGLYLLPTFELLGWLARHIGERSAIEIGAGNGVMADALGIPATDSHLQDLPEIARYYIALGQPTITYGPKVIKLEASAAVKRFRPEVVIAAWITHRYNSRRQWAGGNQHGPNVDWIRDRVDEFVFIGNTETHKRHPLMAEVYAEHVTYPEWLFSRARGGQDFIAWWSRPAT